MLTITELDYPAGLYQPRHAHPNASVTLVLSGSLEERVGGRAERGLALGVVVKPAGVEHDDRFGGSGARTVQIGISGDAGRELERRDELLGRWAWFPAGAAVAPFLRLIEALQARGADGETQDLAWDVLGALSQDGAAPATPRERSAPPAWLAAVRERVDDLPGEPHRVCHLAGTAGVHPVHLAREFRRHYGTSVSDHVQLRRLQAAAELLASSDAPIASVAAQAGFADQSHLGRQLRSRAGITPARLRHTARRCRLQPF